jgi:hypothetical protein|tara:strand:+ start:239 stop:514 length:276 start_codon:yes stop_codon:yes gene_type:complete
MTCDKQNIQRIIVIIQSSEGTILVNPLALLAKELEAVPRPIAKIKIKYGSRVFIIGGSYLRGILHLLIKPSRHELCPKVGDGLIRRRFEVA